MGIFPDLLGTLLGSFQLGIGGARLKSNNGVVEARNAADSAYAAIASSSLNLAEQVTLQGVSGNVLQLIKSDNLSQFGDLQLDDLLCQTIEVDGQVLLQKSSSVANRLEVRQLANPSNYADLYGNFVGGDYLYAFQDLSLGDDGINAPVVWLFGSGTNRTRLQAASSVTGDRLITLPDRSGEVQVNQAGSILQTKTVTFTAPISTTSTTFVSTGWSNILASNLKSSSSKVRINFNAYAGASDSLRIHFTVYRNGVDLSSGGRDMSCAITPGGGTGGVAIANLLVWAGFEWEDSPGSTTPATYTVYWYVSSGSRTGYLNRRGLDTVVNTIATLTLTEIAA